MHVQISFRLACLRRAWEGSVDKANAWAPILGALIVWWLLKSTGIETTMPDTILGTLQFALVCLGAAWVVIFVYRLLLAPGRLYEEAQLRIKYLESELSGKTANRRIRNTLAGFLTEGKKLLVQCSDENAPSPDNETTVWHESIELFLRTELEESLVARLNDPSGLPMTFMSGPHAKTWGGVHFRMARLNQFIQEYAD